MSYKLENFFSEGLPDPAGSYTGFPKYNFVGGHNSEKKIPIKELVKSAERVILKEGKNLALYGHNNGPQGNLALREFLTTYLYNYTGMKIDNTSASIDLDWVGGAAPSAANGSGYDIYSFTIMKVNAAPVWHVIGNTLGAV